MEGLEKLLDDLEKTLEDFEAVDYRMEEEGFHYCFKSYSSFKEIEDLRFHELRLTYLESAKVLEEYVLQKIEEIRDNIEDVKDKIDYLEDDETLEEE